MAMLLAALLGFGRLSGDSEVIALFASGVSLYRVAVPVVFLSIAVTVLGFVLNENVVPKTFSEHERLRRELMKERLSSQKPFFVPDAKDGVTKSIVWVQGGFDASKRMMRDVTMIRYWQNKPVAVICAKEAVWKEGNAWSFREGYTQNLGAEYTMAMPFEKLDTKEIRFDKTPQQLALYRKKSEEFSFSELRSFIGMRQHDGDDVTELRVQLYQKIALPLASLVFALIGTPLGLRPHRSSSAMGLGLSIVIIFGYWVLMHYMTILGNNGAVTPAAAAFIPTMVGVAAGAALIARAAK
jgi:lipopolysaccharide export system permease protein